MSLSNFAAFSTIIIPILMGYVAYKYPFNTEDGKHTIYLQIFRILLFISVIAGAYMVYSSTKDTDEIKLGQKDLLIIQQKVEVGQKDLQIAQLTLNINQKDMNDKILYLTGLNDSQKATLDKLRSNDSTTSSSLSLQMGKLKKSNDSLRTKEIDPLLDIMPDDNPIIKSSWHGIPNALVFVISEVIEKAVATNLNTKTALVYIQGNDTLFEMVNTVNLKSDIIHYDKGYSLWFGLDIKSKIFLTHNIYFCLKTNYTNRDGTLQRPLVKIFNITNQLNQRFLPIYDTTYDNILNYLTSRKYF